MTEAECERIEPAVAAIETAVALIREQAHAIAGLKVECTGWQFLAQERYRKIAELDMEIERLVKARERADEDAKAEISMLRARLPGADKGALALAFTLASDAQRSLELDDKQGALGCLRELLRNEPITEGKKV